MISGIIHVLKSGGRWPDTPRDQYGPHKTHYNRFVRLAEKGVWADLFHALAQAGGPPAQVLIDSTAVRAHRSAAGGNIPDCIAAELLLPLAPKETEVLHGDKDFDCNKVRRLNRPGNHVAIWFESRCDRLVRD